MSVSGYSENLYNYSVHNRMQITPNIQQIHSLVDPHTISSLLQQEFATKCIQHSKAAHIADPFMWGFYWNRPYNRPYDSRVSCKSRAIKDKNHKKALKNAGVGFISQTGCSTYRLDWIKILT